MSVCPIVFRTHIKGALTDPPARRHPDPQAFRIPTAPSTRPRQRTPRSTPWPMRRMKPRAEPSPRSTRSRPSRTRRWTRPPTLPQDSGVAGGARESLNTTKVRFGHLRLCFRQSEVGRDCRARRFSVEPHRPLRRFERGQRKAIANASQRDAGRHDHRGRSGARRRNPRRPPYRRRGVERASNVLTSARETVSNFSSSCALEARRRALPSCWMIAWGCGRRLPRRYMVRLMAALAMWAIALGLARSSPFFSLRCSIS